MSRLLRMDRSGHTELAAWSAGDSGSHDRAATIFDEQLAGGYMGVAKLPRRVVRAGEGAAGGRRATCCCGARSSAGSGSGPGRFPSSKASPGGGAPTSARCGCGSGSRPRYTALYVTPLIVVAVVLFWLEPLLVPGLARSALVHAWVIPELFANRGAGVVRVSRRSARRAPEQRRAGAAGRPARPRRARPAAPTPAWRSSAAGWASGWWARPARCWCAPAGGACTPSACAWPTRTCPARTAIAHLLLALREDEQGFATVANHAFAGATWRMRRRLAPRAAPRARRRRRTRRVSAPGSPRRLSQLAGTSHPRAARSTPRSPRTGSGRRPSRARPAALRRRAPGRRPPGSTPARRRAGADRGRR